MNALMVAECFGRRVMRLSVDVFPILNKTTVGGCPYKVTRSCKSASKVTILQSCLLAKSQISRSLPFSRPNSLT